MGVVFCREGEVKEAKSGDKFDFGHVDSCITITCNLEGGSRIAGHFVQLGDSKAMLEKMRAAVRLRSIETINVVGQLTTWTPDLQDQSAVVEQATKNWSADKKEELQSMTTDEVQNRYGDEFRLFSISYRRSELAKFLAGQLGCTKPMHMVWVAPFETGHLSY